MVVKRALVEVRNEPKKITAFRSSVTAMTRVTPTCVSLCVSTGNAQVLIRKYIKESATAGEHKCILDKLLHSCPSRQ